MYYLSSPPRKCSQNELMTHIDENKSSRLRKTYYKKDYRNTKGVKGLRDILFYDKFKP